MEVKIGVQNASRELVIDTDQSNDEVEKAVAEAVEQRLLVLTDTKGRRVIVPTVLPALLTGFALAFARALGEYGSVVFISGNKALQTEITSLLIITKLEQYDYVGATAIASVMLLASFALLLAINTLQWWTGRGRLKGV